MPAEIVKIIGLDDLETYLDIVIDSFPKAARQDVEEIANDFAFGLAMELRSQFPELYWKGDLIESITVEPTSAGFVIPMSIEGILIDEMREHKAPVWEPSPLTGTILGEWALDKFPEEESIPNVMVVHPHPWIEPAMLIGESMIDKRLGEGHIHKLIERK